MNDANFPSNFLDQLANAPGFDAESFIKTHQLSASPTSIRLNPFKNRQAPSTEHVAWCNDGYYLPSRPSFTFDPLFHAGCYYVQEASSMFIDHIYRYINENTRQHCRALDLCAAPGGKSTLLNSAMKSDDLLVSNEIIKTRVPILTDNLTRWGTANTVVTNNDPRDFGRLKGFFDTVLVDAPCSGSGMFRKDGDAMDEWSEDNVNLCQQRQERILSDVYPAIKEDGYLIYSTCSYSVKENEEVLDWLCGEFGFESVRIPIEKDWGIVESQSDKYKAWGYRFYPDKVKGEGLFAACLRKTENSGNVAPAKGKEHQKADFKQMDLVKPYLSKPDNFFFLKVNEGWIAINREHKDDLAILQRYLYIKKSGIRLGKMMGKDFIPDHELALSLILNKDKFLQTSLNKDQAIQYLKRENLSDFQSNEKGWSLMMFENHALGWAKLLPNRVNNYYPKEIRIMSQGSGL